MFPEMAVTGYPPEDLLLKPDFVEAAMASLQRLAPATRGLTAVVGCVHAAGDLFNATAVFHDSHLAGIYHKQYLPNYGVFDEERYFRPGGRTWYGSGTGSRWESASARTSGTPRGPPEAQALQAGAEVLINISASSYHVGKGQARERMLATRAADMTAFVAYCNLVGGQDELIFDGYSLVCGPQGELIARGKTV
ncbi:MAG: hypothetical protein D6793_04700 [Thermoflexia bacterium]|nr:MAG: hypothetical protein D6793_04700 [Thermoflexia bacterium]